MPDTLDRLENRAPVVSPVCLECAATLECRDGQDLRGQWASEELTGLRANGEHLDQAFRSVQSVAIIAAFFPYRELPARKDNPAILASKACPDRKECRAHPE